MRAVAATAVLGCLLALTGCGDDEDNQKLPPVDPPSTTSSSTPPSPSKSPSATASPSPSVSPAPDGADLERAQKSAYKNALS
ncbi:MAG: hypothetical protein ACRDQA_10985, partial [Nocardioidaceae bacterium]